MTVVLKFGSASLQLDEANPRALLGRDQDGCDLAVADPSVSRRHAEVYLEGGHVYLRDLGSSNGTWVNARVLGAYPFALEPGQVVYVGHTPLGVEWQRRGGSAATVMAPLTPELLAAMTRHQQRPQTEPVAGSPAAFAAEQARARAGVGVAATVGVGGSSGPAPADMSYRRQAGNNNGTLLIALPSDTFSNASTLDGFVEFTATDDETVASVIVELVEFHKQGHKKGHVWDRCLVRQGPWKTKKDDVLPMPFSLRIPSGTSQSSPICHWEVKAYVDIAWAMDVDATSPITMRNSDVDKIRDALGTLDYRINQLDATPLGQRYLGKFNPPLHLAKKLNITDINLEIEYLGLNLKVVMEVEKNKLFHFDKRQEFVFDLAKLRSSTVQDVAQHLQIEITKMMG